MAEFIQLPLPMAVAVPVRAHVAPVTDSTTHLVRLASDKDQVIEELRAQLAQKDAIIQELRAKLQQRDEEIAKLMLQLSSMPMSDSRSSSPLAASSTGISTNAVAPAPQWPAERNVRFTLDSSVVHESKAVVQPEPKPEEHGTVYTSSGRPSKKRKTDQEMAALNTNSDGEEEKKDYAKIKTNDPKYTFKGRPTTGATVYWHYKRQIKLHSVVTIIRHFYQCTNVSARHAAHSLTRKTLAYDVRLFAPVEGPITEKDILIPMIDFVNTIALNASYERTWHQNKDNRTFITKANAKHENRFGASVISNFMVLEDVPKIMPQSLAAALKISEGLRDVIQRNWHDVEVAAKQLMTQMDVASAALDSVAASSSS